ncbi:MAG: hypothetical protein IJF82_20900 [Achromobacter sp.]|nr:hypothetical protein [Achromobacter sp.]MBQ3612739.1 hypothetical protein [Bacteroidales bacterium]
MAITAYQVAYSQSTGNGLVTPVVDRRLYEFLLLNTVGVADGVAVTNSGTNLIVSSGWGVIKGCVFGVTAETISATKPASGSANGRLLIELDATNGTIQFKTQQGSTLPALTQEDINGSGSVYQMELATYTISATDITGLTETYETLQSAQSVIGEITALIAPLQTKLDTIETGAQVNSVTSVAGKTGAVTLEKSDVGLGNVVNKALTMSLSGTTLTINYT